MSVSAALIADAIKLGLSKLYKTIKCKIKAKRTDSVKETKKTKLVRQIFKPNEKNNLKIEVIDGNETIIKLDVTKRVEEMESNNEK
jgi:hypothetical protein